jgi:hypothetical protein
MTGAEQLAIGRVRSELAYLREQIGEADGFAPADLRDYAAGFGRLRGVLKNLEFSLRSAVAIAEREQ